MQIDLTKQKFRALLDLVYIGNWVLNSTRGQDRFKPYDDLESKLFALSPALSEEWNGTVVPSQAFARDVAEQVIFMDGGVIVEHGPAAQVIDHPTQERTRQFLSRYAEN